MDEKPETATPKDEEKSFIWRGFVLWPVVILMFYILSIGPVWKLAIRQNNRGAAEKFLETFYAPLAWAYEHTPLHRSLGLYLHLWDPKSFDKDGEFQLFH